MVLTDLEKVEFEERGILFLKDFIPANLLDNAKSTYFEYMSGKGIRQSGNQAIRQSGNWTLDDYPITAPVNTSAILVKDLKQRNEFAAVFTPQISSVVSELLNGESATTATKFPQLLFTLPNAERWKVPLGAWHTDVPRFPEGIIPGVQVFTFLDQVLPECGGTLAIAGSHKLLNDGTFKKSKAIARQLSKTEYFATLITNENIDRRSLCDVIGNVDGENLQVQELSGKPGDVIFTDMRIIHTSGYNAGNSPRAMLTHRFLLEKYQSFA